MLVRNSVLLTTQENDRNEIWVVYMYFLPITNNYMIFKKISYPK